MWQTLGANTGKQCGGGAAKLVDGRMSRVVPHRSGTGILIENVILHSIEVRIIGNYVYKGLPCACGEAKRHIFCNSVRYFAHLHLDGLPNGPVPVIDRCKDLGNRSCQAKPVAVPGSLEVDNGPQRSAFITGAYETFD